MEEVKNENVEETKTNLGEKMEQEKKQKKLSKLNSTQVA